MVSPDFLNTLQELNRADKLGQFKSEVHQCLID
jgi:hypothetical protein